MDSNNGSFLGVLGNIIVLRVEFGSKHLFAATHTY